MITRETTNFSDCDFNGGEIILADKPVGWSSFKVIYKIRNATGAKKVGHAGTLDPNASGLLIVCTGKKTKEITKFQDLEKTYTGTILLGKTSPSMDLETEITQERLLDGITEVQILELRNEFTGTIRQIPPMFSAIKHKGKSLYHLARQGKTVHREAREVTISKFSISKISLPEIYFEITCTKGTYIRVIAHDFGERLGCGGLLSSLRRTNIGSFSVDNAVIVDDFVEKVSVQI
ncbi:MAG: tRNA pseudouridine(55) synthase TruB [Ignavibacteriaceae bacterium]